MPKFGSPDIAVILPSEPVPGTPGQRYYNSTTNIMYYYNGTNWVSGDGGTENTAGPFDGGNASTVTTDLPRFDFGRSQ